ncbi:MAG TPA: hypothetical protein VG106_04065, partial [Vicinamibacterales bacterium]|nr:hypothetical protein [Vicinamibacterales bacterium]
GTYGKLRGAFQIQPRRPILIRSLAVGLFSLLISTAAMALPDRAVVTTYYDCTTNEQVGSFSIWCWGSPQFTGQTTDCSTTEVIEECHDNVEPITCADQGLTTIGSCGNPDWCVSQGYLYSYNGGLAQDCWGQYVCGDPGDALPCD